MAIVWVVTAKKSGIPPFFAVRFAYYNINAYLCTAKIGGIPPKFAVVITFLRNQLYDNS